MDTTTSSQAYGSQNDVLRKTIMRKIDLHVLPCLAVLWLANFIDRSNVGNARIAGLEKDLHLKGNQFNIALAAFFVSYLIVEIPSNLLLGKIKANRWLPALICAWGIVTVLTCLVHNFSGLLAARFFLGICEGGLFPGMIFYLSNLYPRYELQLRIGIFYTAVSISGAFGGLLAAAIIKMDGVGGLAGWRWIFVLEGLATFCFGLVVTFFLPADLRTAPFLTDDEKNFYIQHCVSEFAPNRSSACDVDGSLSAKEKTGELPKEDLELREIVRGLCDLQTWLTGIGSFGVTVAVYSYSLFLPTIITGLGFSGEQAQLHTVPPYVPSAFLTVALAYLSDRLQLRGPLILLCMPVAIVGFILAIVGENIHARYAAMFLIAIGLFPCSPGLVSILPNNHSGQYKRATSIGLQHALANSGGLVATFVYTTDQKPRYVRGHSVVLGFLCLSWTLILFNVIYCRYENGMRKKGKRNDNILHYQELFDSGRTKAPIGDRHPNFRFTL